MEPHPIPLEDRWHAARRTLAQFVLRRPDDRFALILFSAHPVTLSPLTADHLRLLRMLARLDIDSRDDGTAIGSALMTAVRRLEDSPARSRVILLITDGVQNRGRVSPQEAAEGTVEAWARAANNPVSGWYGTKKGLRGRFGNYVPPLMEALGLAEVEHGPRNNRMRAI